MQGFTHQQDIREDWKMTAECDVCATVIVWTPDYESPHSNILASNMNQLKRTFNYYLPLKSFKELSLIHLAITLENESKTFARNRFWNISEG